MQVWRLRFEAEKLVSLLKRPWKLLIIIFHPLRPSTTSPYNFLFLFSFHFFKISIYLIHVNFQSQSQVNQHVYTLCCVLDWAGKIELIDLNNLFVSLGFIISGLVTRHELAKLYLIKKHNELAIINMVAVLLEVGEDFLKLDHLLHFTLNLSFTRYLSLNFTLSFDYFILFWWREIIRLREIENKKIERKSEQKDPNSHLSCCHEFCMRDFRICLPYYRGFYFMELNIMWNCFSNVLVYVWFHFQRSDQNRLWRCKIDYDMFGCV